MPRNKQSARKSVGGAPNKARLVQEARRQAKIRVTSKWVYAMVRFIDIADSIDLDNISSFSLLQLLLQVSDIYNFFGLENSNDNELHIIVGLETRQEMENRLDAYVLIGMRIGLENEPQFGLSESEVINEWLAIEPQEEEESLMVFPHHVRFIDNIDELNWLIRIVRDMEDVWEHGEIGNVVF